MVVVSLRPGATDNRGGAVNAMVGRVIAISRTPPWLVWGWGCRSASFHRREQSLWKSYPAQQVGKAGIGVQAVEERVNFDERSTRGSLLIGFV